MSLHTPRLQLRPWSDADREPFAALNRDPEVMRYFPSPLTHGQSDALLARIELDFEEQGFGLWAVEELSSGQLVGFTGLAIPAFQAHFTPAVEIGWRLARWAWGKGYATEAALAAVEFAFQAVGLQQVVAFTTVANERSRAVMRRIGMTRDPREDFDHPGLAAGDALRRHVLYRITVERWRLLASDSCARTVG